MSDQELHSSDQSRFSLDVVQLVTEVYGTGATAILEALPKPVQTYYVRCNTLKISPDDLMNRLESRGLRVSQHPVVSEALGIRVEGPFDILTKGRKIIVDKHTAESVLQGANVYAPGVIECGSLRSGDQVTVLSEMDDVLGTGEAMMNTNDILTFRRGLAVRLQERQYKSPQIRELPEFAEGLLYPQSLAAMVTSHVLGPKEGECVVDMNCAPGGKLSHISQLMRNTGKVYGLDRNSEKVARTRQTVVHLGCSNVTVSIHDSRYAADDLPDLQADRVLIDPPCSALGLRPKIYDSTSREKVNALADYQRQFLKSAARVVKPGGVVVYSVCTITKQECEETVEFAEHECGLHVVEQTPLVGSTDFRNAEVLKTFCQRFHPITDEIGYFIGRFER
ncbi:MAG TPA: PUA domain-containing protein [Candidatus Acidoferrales bacterium]|nr:PUA domain-containing protein [Candidatus Acidoferrales bacterium]